MRPSLSRPVAKVPVISSRLLFGGQRQFTRPFGVIEGQARLEAIPIDEVAGGHGRMFVAGSVRTLFSDRFFFRDFERRPPWPSPSESVTGAKMVIEMDRVPSQPIKDPPNLVRAGSFSLERLLSHIDPGTAEESEDFVRLIYEQRHIVRRKSWSL